MIKQTLLKNPKSSTNEQITSNTVSQTWLNIQGSLLPQLTEELDVLIKKQQELVSTIIKDFGVWMSDVQFCVPAPHGWYYGSFESHKKPAALLGRWNWTPSVSILPQSLHAYPVFDLANDYPSGQENHQRFRQVLAHPHRTDFSTILCKWPLSVQRTELHPHKHKWSKEWCYV